MDYLYRCVIGLALMPFFTVVTRSVHVAGLAEQDRRNAIITSISGGGYEDADGGGVCGEWGFGG